MVLSEGYNNSYILDIKPYAEFRRYIYNNDSPTETMKYYNSFHLKDVNLLESIESASFYLKVFYSFETGCNIGERYNDKGEVYWVVYYTDVLSEETKKHYAKCYTKAVCCTCKSLKNGVLMTFYINEFEISKYLIQTYFTDGRLKLMQEFDAEFELVEYREEFYNSRHELITEKIFYAESWTIHEEDLI